MSSRSLKRAPTVQKAARGMTSNLAGAAAEEIVAGHYRRLGCRVLEQRWRGEAGEIDLIFQQAGTTVFVEVKRSRTRARAAESLRPKQIARLMAAAGEYMAGLPDGANSDVRFDVALVSGAGLIEVLEGALGA